MKWLFCLFLFAGLEKFLEEVKLQLRPPHREKSEILSAEEMLAKLRDR